MLRHIALLGAGGALIGFTGNSSQEDLRFLFKYGAIKSTELSDQAKATGRGVLDHYQTCGLVYWKGAKMIQSKCQATGGPSC